MTANGAVGSSLGTRTRALCVHPFHSIKFFVFCQGLLQLAQLLVSGYLKSSISTIERRYGMSSQKSGLLASFNEVGNTVLIVFVSYFGSRVHRPRCIGVGALIASLAVLLMALPHFLSGPYQYSHSVTNVSDLCSPGRQTQSNGTQTEGTDQEKVLPIMLMGQLMLGIGGVPIQPFGISYIDDYASKRNSPLYLGIMFAVTVIGPAFGYMLGSLLLRFYVDLDKLAPDEIQLDNSDARWVGAWWLGFLLASCILFLTSLPYFFFPAKMPKEEPSDVSTNTQPEKAVCEKNLASDLTLLEFLKAFPRIVVRTLRNPIFLLVVLAQVNLAAMVAGLATFMPKFIEQQFSKTASLSNLILGSVNIPAATVGIMAGGAIMRKLCMSVKTSAKMCTIVVITSVLVGMPMLFLGCSTQNIKGVYPYRENISCSRSCVCDLDTFNPVCSHDRVEFQSPCHAGCLTTTPGDIRNYTECSCIGPNGTGSVRAGSCGTACSHLFLPFVVLCTLAGFMASLSQTPSFMMILRTVKPEDKSFALGIQFMMFRVLAFMPGPVIYGSAIDTACIMWGSKGNKRTSCRYFNLDLFRQRFLGLQIFFLFSGFVCFLLSLRLLSRTGGELQPRSQEDRERDSGKKADCLLLDNNAEEMEKGSPSKM